ncbi:glycosyltransferase family 4 protein [Granulibacter bethesdensis]|uniref:glycosyltransferase family 4 protein n=1 Tax=Granulibacter bethesdensis TaxID=364410 RepID=UPI0003F1EB18|nr:glycosyltransferase family 4 protein [Granulibacter bethesdensis]AHJ67562.1 Glycosyltransferase [Granulibacter bethesdensis]
MKIAQISPLYERVPPRLYGGTERIVSFLTEELVAQGHEVTLFASGDSITKARLVSPCDVALRLNPEVKLDLPWHTMQLEQVRQMAHEFDVLHFHTDLIHFPVVRPFSSRTLTTLHGRLDLKDLPGFYRMFSEIPVVSISDNQRAPMPPVNWAGTVLHGLPADLLPFSANPKGGYFAFLGRISPEKGPDRAIEIATRAGVRLKIAAKVDKADQHYWDTVIKPMVDANPLVEYIGEINEQQKAEFLGNATALLFPIDWPEPFGLVMIEAMACGTPVIAWRNGSVPEVMQHGKSGMIISSMDEAVAAVRHVESMDRAGVRACFDDRFTAARMARDYVHLYELAAQGAPLARVA